jgi:hypothetical protein
VAQEAFSPVHASMAFFQPAARSTLEALHAVLLLLYSIEVSFRLAIFSSMISSSMVYSLLFRLHLPLISLISLVLPSFWTLFVLQCLVGPAVRPVWKDLPL